VGEKTRQKRTNLRTKGEMRYLERGATKDHKARFSDGADPDGQSKKKMSTGVGGGTASIGGWGFGRNPKGEVWHKTRYFSLKTDRV